MNATKKETIYIIGIGGIGMSAIAEILHNSNYKVQGSDIQSNANTCRLQKLGIKVYIGHNANNIMHSKIIIHSSAIQSNNIELVTARKSNKTILQRSDILTKIMKDKYVIAVSGSSGKTTTTAMIASILDYSNKPLFITQATDTRSQEENLNSSIMLQDNFNTGIDATVIVGGILNSYKSNSKLGKSNIFLIEADESDGTMLRIPVNIAVITSINDDHTNYYKTFNNLKKAFSQFANKADFAILPNSDSININHNLSNFITFGLESGNIKANNIKQHAANSIKFDVLVNNNYKIKNVILSNTIGIHKVINALAAISVAIKLGISSKEIKKGLLEFKGVVRRFSLIANIKGIKLIEDYAHNPNEIQATLTAARSITKKKVIGIIELSRFTRIYNSFDEFIRIFMMFDYIILTPIHPPKDKPIPGCRITDIKKNYSAKDLVI
ncbi:UDP-N-acetylmuramate--L-alanine ligase [Wolbachia endosymbiont of Dipetalonema caudispina]|uniref:UDP-N-acetylmuramate--L-alanine ligase n=1 Tax=Wolbachia endosymbiont of Dipetalonema caudispina TaxID=1812112 RepID=UPI002102CC11|nr:Mur ligase domain-containing protein [Wolbachia endosymbiont of Dipetalonema caudispina]